MLFTSLDMSLPATFFFWAGMDFSCCSHNTGRTRHILVFPSTHTHTHYTHTDTRNCTVQTAYSCIGPHNHTARDHSFVYVYTCACHCQNILLLHIQCVHVVSVRADKDDIPDRHGLCEGIEATGRTGDSLADTNVGTIILTGWAREGCRFGRDKRS